MAEWIGYNKEWLFSGIGLCLISFIIWIIKNIWERKGKKKSNQSINMYGENNVYVEKNDGEINIS